MDVNSLLITCIQRHCLHDGPGVRTTVFLKGCYLRCPWCCNPETISPIIEYFFNEDKCMLNHGIFSRFCGNCELNNGNISKYECRFHTFNPTANRYSVNELTDELMKDRSLYEDSSGGVTFSGGEPFMQSEPLALVMKQLKNHQINIAIETSAFFPNNKLDQLQPYIDLYYIDLKFQLDYIPNKELSHPASLIDFDKNMKALEKNKIDKIFRLVYIPEAFNTTEKVKKLISTLKRYNIQTIQLLDYHNLAQSKYKKLKLQFRSFSLPKNVQKELFTKELSSSGINIH